MENAKKYSVSTQEGFIKRKYTFVFVTVCGKSQVKVHFHKIAPEHLPKNRGNSPKRNSQAHTNTHTDTTTEEDAEKSEKIRLKEREQPANPYIHFCSMEKILERKTSHFPSPPSHIPSQAKILFFLLSSSELVSWGTCEPGYFLRVIFLA